MPMATSDGPGGLRRAIASQPEQSSPPMRLSSQARAASRCSWLPSATRTELAPRTSADRAYRLKLCPADFRRSDAPLRGRPPQSHAVPCRDLDGCGRRRSRVKGIELQPFDPRGRLVHAAFAQRTPKPLIHNGQRCLRHVPSRGLRKRQLASVVASVREQGARGVKTSAMSGSGWAKALLKRDSGGRQLPRDRRRATDRIGHGVQARVDFRICRFYRCLGYIALAGTGGYG